MDFDRVNHDRTLYVLIGTTHGQDRQVISQCIQLNRPGSKLLYCSTANEVMDCLRTTAAEYYNFPSLLLLDMAMAPQSVIWGLINEIRTQYRLLPVVLIGSDEPAEAIQQAYSIGAHAFVYRSGDKEEWQARVNMLAYYWLQVVHLPKQNPLD